MPIDPMMRERALTLEYLGPRKGCVLALLTEGLAQMGSSTLLSRLWRRRSQRPYLTIRQAATFCSGRKCMFPDERWAFAQWPEEDSPVDVVLRRERSGETTFEFVQLKEWVPAELNSEQTLQSLLDRLPRR